VLVFPYAVGSSVGAYAIYSLKEYGNAPNAMICLKADITTASGCAIANIPTIDLPVGTALGTINSGSTVRVDASAERATVTI
jgi:predicted aconitase with swiveling domain